MITEVAVDTLINREETFGPIVPLIRVGSDDEALAVANDSHLGLQAAVYTSNLKRAFKYLDNLQVGNVVVNDRLLGSPRALRGRIRHEDRLGPDRRRYTMLDMTDLKTIVLDVGGLD